MSRQTNFPNSLPVITIISIFHHFCVEIIIIISRKGYFSHSCGRSQRSCLKLAEVWKMVHRSDLYLTLLMLFWKVERMQLEDEPSRPVKIISSDQNRAYFSSNLLPDGSALRNTAVETPRPYFVLKELIY
ncbi:uncharacterized protein LOC129749870 [Uranotaenia lowii]|uniref:uncharacterized protein LOC129749870 n=1 Tax=Uranotaenia lowii TaxID=190385 RepID=UPI002478DF74|nr:uncharacterized protein LOC129749870 [Uranotaenia lowii]